MSHSRHSAHCFYSVATTRLLVSFPDRFFPFLFVVVEKGSGRGLYHIRLCVYAYGINTRIVQNIPTIVCMHIIKYIFRYLHRKIQVRCFSQTLAFDEVENREVTLMHSPYLAHMRGHKNWIIPLLHLVLCVSCSHFSIECLPYSTI